MLSVSPPAAGVGVRARTVEPPAELSGGGGRGDRSHRQLSAPDPSRQLTCVGTGTETGRTSGAVRGLDRQKTKLSL